MSDNPPAFPRAGLGGFNSAQDGMTLRDWFAGQFIASLATIQIFPDNEAPSPEKSAVFAYRYADAMLAERQKGAK